MLINQVQAYLPPISFENPDYVSNQTIGNTPGSGWNLYTGAASVSPVGTGYGGGQALKLGANPQQEPFLTRDIAWNPAQKTAFIDLQLKPAADPQNSYATFYANGTQLAFQVPQGGNFGEIWVYHGSEGTANAAQWAKTIGTFALAPNGLTASTYTRITLRHDYQRNIWDLFIGGKLAAANLAFEGRGSNLEKLELYGSKVGDTLIDNLSAQEINMLFTDTDKDGLPNDWENANGSNPNLYDRDNIKPGTGKSFLDHYMDSLWTGGLNGSAPLPAQGSIPPLSILGSHQPVASLKGSLTVGGDGSSSYSMPIDIPKGTGGMEPKISLNYSSNGGNGAMGLGWSLGGFQSITRGPATQAKDNFAGAVRFDGSDRFFFNGERLVCISGIYGVQGSQYRTEIDSFSRFTLMGGSQASAASWWQVETKAGLILELGKTADSKVISQLPAAPISWDVSRVSDTLGNYYSVSWSGVTSPGNNSIANRRVAGVAYTGNALQGLSPYCFLDFNYGPRDDSSYAYHPSGIRFDNNQRLSSITVRTGGSVNHTYILAYGISHQSGRSILLSVLKQAASGHTTSPTVFNWQGLASGASKWAESANTQLPVYDGGNLDATDQNINSVVETAGTSIRLEGGAARALPLDPDLSVTTPSYVDFEFRAGSLDKGAYLIIDNDTDWDSGSEFGIHISPSASLSSPISQKRTVLYTNTSGVWQTYRVALQGDPNSAKNLAAGTYPYLGFVNYDKEDSNGTGWAEFRNIRFGSAAALDANQIPAITFPQVSELPRFSSSSDATRGVRMMDLNADGLIDLTDFRVTNWNTVNGQLVADTPDRVAGNVYLNTGAGFYGASAYLPPNRNPLTDTGQSSAVTAKHDLVSVPCDVNADGMPDLLVTDQRQAYSSSTSINKFRFLTHNGTAWVELSAYAPHFESRNNSSSQGTGGKRHLISRDLIDFDKDGYPDLYINTSESGWLANVSSAASLPTSAKIVLEDTRTVFLNRIHLGQGWVKTDTLAPPERLLVNYDDRTADIGRRLIDINGDGFLDYVRSTVETSNSPFVDDRFAQRSWPASAANALPSWLSPANPPSQDLPKWWLPTATYPSTSLMGTGNPQTCNANAPFVKSPDSNTARATSGTYALDVNGDGLTDLVRAYARTFSSNTKIELSHSTWLNTGDTSSASTTRWLRDSAAYGVGYNLPLSLDSDVGETQPCFQIADLNGDGLTDILYSRGGNDYIGPNGKRTTVSTDPFGGTNNGAFINTGTGWVANSSWGLPGTYRLGKENETDPASIMADINGDGFPDIITDIADGKRPKLLLNQCVPEVITSVVDGFGSQLQVEYRRLNDPTPTTAFGTRVFEKSTGTLPAGHAPVIDSRLVVARYSEPNGMGGRKYRSQRYGDLRYDRTNETSLGFGWIEALDESNGQLTRTDYRRDFPFAGSPMLTQTSVNLTAADIANMPPNSGTPYFAGRKNLSIETATYAEMATQAGTGGAIRRPVQTGSVLQHFDLDLTLKSQTTTTQALTDFDTYGFVKKSTVTSLDGTSVVTNNTYTHTTSGGKWHLGRLSAATVTKSRSGLATSTKSSSFTYDTATGLLKSETVQPGDPLSIVTTYTHDPFGNVLTTAVAASGLTRTASSTYDTAGRFVIAEANHAGHIVTYSYDINRALLLSTTDIGGLTSWFTYDPFGTLILTHHPDGTKTGEITGYASNLSVPTAVKNLIPAHDLRFFRAKQSSGTPEARVYLDALGRELVTETTILSNVSATGSSRYSKVYAVTGYDAQGRKTAVSESFKPGEAVNFTTISYDLLSRTTRTTRPGNISDFVMLQGSLMLNGQPVTYSKAKNANNQILERWEDQHGKMVLSRDPSGQLNFFQYDIEGRLQTVHILASGALSETSEGSTLSVTGQPLLTNTWDKFGNKVAVSEVNSGASSSDYNGFGEVVSSTNAKGQVTTFTYDSLGRPLTIAKPEGTYTTSYSNTAGATLGKPLSVTGSLGAAGYQETFSYDSLGRPTGTSKSQFGEAFTTSTTSTTYDALGRVSSSTDAGGLTVFNEYDPTFSFPLKRKLAPGTYEGAGTVLWQAGTYDSKGRALTQTLAHGVTTTSAYHATLGDLTALSSSWSGGALQNKAYVWDTLGNLTSRTDHIAGRLETFGYDFLNRLASSTVSSLAGAPTSTVPPPQSHSYSTNGNLLTKGSSATLTYASATRPHAVTSAIVKGFDRSYAYDAAGYVVSDTKRTYAWTSFGQLRQLDYLAAPDLKDFSGNLVHPTATVTSAFDFDSGGNRARQTKERIDANDSRVIEYTLYLGSYERELHQTKTSGGAAAVLAKTIHRHNLGGGVIYTRTVGGPDPGVKLMNVLADHLGSTDVILTGKWNGSAFANHTTERQSFDAWGERRAADTQVNFRATDTDPFRTGAQDYDRGYTGHEQLDDSGLIHMNGRIYDPELGRFLSPDPVVQIPEYSQNFNRYSYVLNNPLNATDPSGFSFLSKVFGKIGNFIKENWRTIVSIVVGAILVFSGIGATLFAAWYAGSGVVLTPLAYQIGAGALAGALGGSVVGGLNAALAGGDIGDILRGAAIGGIQGGISGGILHGMELNATGFADKAAHVAGHGILGGAANEAMGGKFQDGFLSAAAGAAAGWMGAYKAFAGKGAWNVAGRTTVAGVVGGTASALGGGKFANGAYTAAFQHLLNAELGQKIRDEKLFEEAVARVDAEVATGKEVNKISFRDMLTIADAELQRIKSGSAYIQSLSNEEYVKFCATGATDGIFHKRWGSKSFNITGIKGIIYNLSSSQTYSGKDINYYYFGMVSAIRNNSASWGSKYGQAGNIFHNGKQAFSLSPIYHLDQIGKGGGFIQLGSTMWGLQGGKP
jgi:RHS repeat-associated protein